MWLEASVCGPWGEERDKPGYFCCLSTKTSQSALAKCYCSSGKPVPVPKRPCEINRLSEVTGQRHNLWVNRFAHLLAVHDVTIRSCQGIHKVEVMRAPSYRAG